MIHWLQTEKLYVISFCWRRLIISFLTLVVNVMPSSFTSASVNIPNISGASTANITFSLLWNSKNESGISDSMFMLLSKSLFGSQTASLMISSSIERGLLLWIPHNFEWKFLLRYQKRERILSFLALQFYVWDH